MEKSNETKSWFFEKINTIEKTSSTIEKKEKEKTNYQE